MGHISRSSGLFRCEVSRDRVCQSNLKTVGGACGIITEIVWSGSRRWMGRATGCVGSFYPKIILFPVLCHRII
jgi:hypothetical protein